MKHLSILLFFLSVNIGVNAQQWDWAKLLQTTAIISETEIINDVNGNLYLKGSLDINCMFEGVSLNKGSFISKFNSAGNILWAKNIPGIAKMKFNSMGLLCITGVYSNTFSLNTFTLTSNGGKDIYLVKLDANGQAVAIKSFGNTGDDNAVGLDVDLNDNIYITGAYKDSISFGSTILKDIYGCRPFYLACLDSSLNEKWTSTGTWTNASGYDVSVDQYENAYVYGNYIDTCYMCYNNGEFIAKFNSSGSLTYSQANSIYSSEHEIETSGSNVHLFGYGCNHQYCTPYMIKYGTQMNQKWIKTTAFDTYHSALTHGAVSANMEITLAGGYGSWAIQDSVKFDNQWIPLKGKNTDIIVARLDSNGNYLWFKTAGGFWDEHAEAISLDKFNNCYVYGRISNYQSRADTVVFDADTLIGNGSSYQYFLAKITQSFATSIPNLQNGHELVLYPNPSTGLLTITSKKKLKATVRIYDVLGNTVFSSVLNGIEESIDLSRQSKGLYFIEVTTSEKRLVEKVVLE